MSKQGKTFFLSQGKPYLIYCAVMLLLCLFTVATAQAVNFKSGGSYIIRVVYRGAGGIVPGELNGQATPLYYYTDNNLPQDAYWIITRTAKGNYLLQNAVTKQYITYDGVYQTGRRYVNLTDEVMGDSSRWDIVESSGSYAIRNCYATDHYFHVRTSNVVGTYTAGGGTAANEILAFYDADGNMVDFSTTGSYTVPKCLDFLSINSQRAVYDKLYKDYLVTLDSRFRGADKVEAEVDFSLVNPAYQLYIDGVRADSGKVFSFKAIPVDSCHKIAVYNDSLLAACDLSFTFLPVVELTATGLSSSYSIGTFTVHDAAETAQDSLYTARLRYRGATAAGWNKKAFAIKLINGAGEDIDRSFFGLRSDNNWILDAMAIDHSRSRNRVSTDLWNSFCTKPYYYEKEPKVITGTRGYFVEVLLNGSYQGLYCMTEKLDRKQLKLKKYEAATIEGEPDTIRGCLYKSYTWGYTAWMGFDSNTGTYPRTAPPSFSNYSETWAQWEMKYPDLADGESVDWKPLYDAINLVAAGDDDTFMQQVDSLFDMPVIRDYYLLMELIFGLDGNGKNLYFFTYNEQKYKMLSLAPWDMDGTWGRFWNGNFEPCNDPSVDLATFLRENKGEHALYHRLFYQDYDRWSRSLADRYAQIRPQFFCADSLIKRFTDYHALMLASGAESREIKRWSGSNGIVLDFEEEMTYLSGWIKGRIEALDAAYGYDPSVGVAEKSLADSYLGVGGGEGTITLRANAPQTVRVYSLQGLLLRTVTVSEGMTQLGGFAPGIYLVNGKKVAVK